MLTAGYSPVHQLLTRESQQVRFFLSNVYGCIDENKIGIGQKVEEMNHFSEKVGNATHNLHCTHCQGSSVTHFKMRCILLGKTKSGKAKVLVFGERNWSGREHIKRIRYVDADRLTTLSPIAK